MKKRHSLLARTAAAVTTLGVALTGAVVLTATPAQARLSETDYGFQTTAYGTRVLAEQVELRSARTAFSYISCTRLAGIDRNTTVDDVANVNANDMIKVGAVVSKNETYREDGRVGVKGTNTIARVELGPEDGPQLLIRGLETTANAWARKGKLHTSTSIDSLPIEVTLDGQTPGTGTPLDDLLTGASDGIQGVLEALQENAGEIEVPGLGTLHIGYERNTVKKRYAAASTYVLRIDLDNGSTVALGRAWARITRDVPAGVFHGVGYGAQIDALDGVVKIGRLATRALPCAGTHGKARESHLAGLDLGAAGMLRLGALTGRSYGVQRKDGSAVGWTEGQVAGITLGTGETQLEIDGIVGRAKVRQTRGGKVLKSAKGTTIGSMTVGGEKQALPDPGQAIEIPGLAIIETNLVDRSKRGIKVTAVKITLLDDTPGASVIKLGNAQVRIKRH